MAVDFSPRFNATNSGEGRYWVGVDVGGTFTDVVVYSAGTGTLEVAKAPTSPADPTLGLLNALLKLKVALPATGRVTHGTTIGTNAILERKGAPVWMITTRGFRDTLEIARTNRTVLYDIRALRPSPLVPRTRSGARRRARSSSFDPAWR